MTPHEKMIEGLVRSGFVTREGNKVNFTAKGDAFTSAIIAAWPNQKLVKQLIKERTNALPRTRGSD